MEKKIGNCKLCGLEKPLINAHLISKNLTKPIFKEFKRVNLVKSQNLDDKRIVQDIFVDNGILCGDCDKKFSLVEKYFKQFISGHLKNRKAVSIGTQHSYPPDYIIDSYDGLIHSNLRLFFLITLWRCSISNLDSFNHINLGINEDWIKNQIETGFLDDDYEIFPVILISLEDVDDIKIDTAITPVFAKWGTTKADVIIFMVNGWMFVYGLKKSDLLWLFENRLLKSGPFNVIRLSHESGLHILNEITRTYVCIKKSTFCNNPL